MSWARYPSTFPLDSPIAELRCCYGEAGLAAIGLHLMAVTYSLRYGTEGYLHYRVLEFLAGGRRAKRLGQLLIDHEMLEKVPDGYQILDFGYYIDAARDQLPPLLRKTIIDRDGNVCGICGDDVELDDIHIDHIVPVSKGGSNRLTNLRVTHARCNMRKGAKV